VTSSLSGCPPSPPLLLSPLPLCRTFRPHPFPSHRGLHAGTQRSVAATRGLAFVSSHPCLDFSRRQYLMRVVPWSGPVFYEACRFEERCECFDRALAVVERGLRTLPRYGPLWFALFRLRERAARDAMLVEAASTSAGQSIAGSPMGKRYSGTPPLVTTGPYGGTTTFSPLSLIAKPSHGKLGQAHPPRCSRGGRGRDQVARCTCSAPPWRAGGCPCTW